MKTEIILSPNSGSAGLGSIYKKINPSCINDEELNKLFLNVNPNVNKSNEYFEAQHIYVLSDEFSDNENDYTYAGRKIIATTDNLKNVLKIPQRFVGILVEEYNKKRNFDNISITVENGNIFLNRKKETFSKEEVIELLKEFNDEFGNLSLWGDFKSSDFPKFNKWIEENL